MSSQPVAFPAFSVLTAREDLGRSDGIFFPDCTSCVPDGVIVTGFKRLLKSHSICEDDPSLLGKTSFCFLMDITVLDLLLRRCQFICQNNFSASSAYN